MRYEEINDLCNRTARELNEISKDCAMELQTETKIRNKGDYQFGLDEWPPTRILSLILALCAWLGWIMHEKHGSREEHPFSPRACRINCRQKNATIICSLV